MPRSIPKCTICSQNVSARQKEGLTCGACNKSQHFECLKISSEKRDAILNSDCCYLCTNCKNKQRLSLSIVATIPEPAKSTKSTKSTKATAPQPTASSSKEKSTTQLLPTTPTVDINNSAVLNASLLEVVLTLQKTVESLNSRLNEALDQIATLTRAQSQGTSQAPSKSRSPQQSNQQSSSFASYSVTGIPPDHKSDAKSIVNRIFKTADSNSQLSSSTRVRQLPIRNEKSTILITVEKDSPNHQLLKEIRRKNFSGSDFSINGTEKIFINESHPSQLYQLFKKTKQLKLKGYRFVWIQSGRVLVKETENSKIIHIRNLDSLDSIISQSNANGEQ